MKTVTRYQCEICKTLYEDVGKALACEAKGIREDLPVGLIFGYRHSLQNYITMAVKDNFHMGHLNATRCWATRDTVLGDTLGPNVCGTGDRVILSAGSAADTEHPTYARMVAYLRSVGVAPLVWNGEKVVPLDGPEGDGGTCMECHRSGGSHQYWCPYATDDNVTE